MAGPDRRPAEGARMRKDEREAMHKERLHAMLAFERALWEGGITNIAGVDEVGRGPLAGPVVAACVVLPEDFSVTGINDSKKLSAKRREALYSTICETALAYGVGAVDNLVIDRINILEATKLAMKAAINEAAAMLEGRGTGPIGHVLVDALTLDGIGLPQTAIIKGDEKSVTVAAASIVAKVWRDRLMDEYHKEYPQYAFDANKGYGTRLHFEGISAAGLSPIHRKTFCAKATKSPDVLP
jgi:ribonuclease HII